MRRRRKMKRNRLVNVDRLGYPSWVDLPMDYWPPKEFHDWLWEEGVI